MVSGYWISVPLRPCPRHFAPLKDWAKISAHIRRSNPALTAVQSRAQAGAQGDLHAAEPPTAR
jgi:hypothetical protein